MLNYNQSAHNVFNIDGDAAKRKSAAWFVGTNVVSLISFSVFLKCPITDYNMP